MMTIYCFRPRSLPLRYTVCIPSWGSECLASILSCQSPEWHFTINLFNFDGSARDNICWTDM